MGMLKPEIKEKWLEALRSDGDEVLFGYHNSTYHVDSGITLGMYLMRNHEKQASHNAVYSLVHNIHSSNYYRRARLFMEKDSNETET